MKSYLTNNIIITRDKPNNDEGLFAVTKEGDILARLDGFLVVPIEKIPDLQGFLQSIKEVTQ